MLCGPSRRAAGADDYEVHNVHHNMHNDATDNVHVLIRSGINEGLKGGVSYSPHLPAHIFS